MSIKAALIFAGLTLVVGCVDHRPIRNGLKNEQIYLEKAALTAPNPKVEGSTDTDWLFRTTIIKASSPNVVQNWAFPGFVSWNVGPVRFQFKDSALQVVDARQLQADDPDDPNDDISTTNPRVMFEFAGRHVDVKLRESLDGERTNYLEENTEEDWQVRQQFAVDFESTSLDPITNFAWFYGDYLRDCASTVSTHMVPGSYEWDEADQYLSFQVEVTYKPNLLSYLDYCYSMVSLLHDVGTATITYQIAFWRPDPSDYEPEVIDEKDPINKQYGTFQRLNVFRDKSTGLLGGESLIARWDPNRKEPVIFHFAEGFPPELKPMWETIGAETNRVLEEAGASLRFEFRDHDWDGVPKSIGDPRYSFVVWHQDLDAGGPLGYGPSTVNPRTGEILSATVNLYNAGYDFLRYYTQWYLEYHGDAFRPPEGQAWEETACTPGATIPIRNPDKRYSAQLFAEMGNVMELPLPEGQSAYRKEDFIPTPVQPGFQENLHKLKTDLRYINPVYNNYVWRSRRALPLDRFAEMVATEREFNDAMNAIMLNQNPFGAVPLYSRIGIDAQNEFLEKFRGWQKNHQALQAHREMAQGLATIYSADPGDLFGAIAKNARKCTDASVWESDEQYFKRLYLGLMFQIAIHEFGHNLSLRHNFYGSADGKHFRRDAEGNPLSHTASVMDYVDLYSEQGHAPFWGGYDEAALSWIYGTEEARREAVAQDFLYCTDEHRSNSPLCRAYDFGTTPAEIVLHQIERYDWQFDVRNRRAFRKFWDTSSYTARVFQAVFDIKRMWHLAIFDWGGGGVQSTLKRLAQNACADAARPCRESATDKQAEEACAAQQTRCEEETVLTEQAYNEIAVDMYNDVSSAVELMIAFYDALINQPASFRNYQTEFDEYYGDIQRIGIIVDKLYATFAFMDLQYIDNYSPRLQTYAAIYDAPFGGRNAALAQRVLDSMLGSNYDTFPWFKYFAINIFAAVTNSNLVSNIELKERIAIERFENEAELFERYGDRLLDQVLLDDNPSHTFVRDGEQYVYTYLKDRNWHLVANKSRSPVAYQFIVEWNEDIDGSASRGLDNYGLKILLAYHEYYNNFVGF